MKKTIIFILSLIISIPLFSQNFEEPQLDGSGFDSINTVIGADFAIQFQGLDQNSDSAIVPLGSYINLPSANFNITGNLAPGIRVNLTTYLSSRHHTEAWVKGGYLLMDELPFFNSEIIDNAMDYLTIKAGVMELNYGDAHFLRSDNGNTTDNLFVGNYIMDAFTTAPALELMFRNNGLLLMAAVTSGSLRPDLVRFSSNSNTYTTYKIGEELAFYWKAGYDNWLSEDFRFRAMLSGYHNQNHHFGSLYSGDRAGSRYYLVMKPQTNSSSDVDPASGHTTGRWGPGFTDKLNSLMLNLFTKYKGLEFFGTVESAEGTSLSGSEFDFMQYAAEGRYRFGGDEQFYLALRYNIVSNDQEMEVDRIQASAGWFMTDNILVKAEYVNQNYTNFINDYGEDAGFNGIMVEAAISF
jgi:hypothetical protein